MTEPLTLRLWPKQGQAFLSQANEVFYGGAGGGGKSHLARVAAIAWCLDIPGLKIALFRRTFSDLWENHMLAPTAFPSMLAGLVTAKQCRIAGNAIRFYNGSRIDLHHCQHEQDMFKYQGAEFHVLCCEISTRVRLANGTTKRVDELKQGDMVATLQGPRAVTAVNARRYVDSVTVDVFDRKGHPIGAQTHGLTHSVLTPDRWESAADRSYGPRLSGFSSPKENRFSGKFASLSCRKSRNPLQSGDSRKEDQSTTAQFSQSPQDHQSRSETCAEMEQELQEISCVSSPCEHPTPPPPFSAHRTPVVLAPHWPQSNQAAPLQPAALPGESSYAGSGKRLGDLTSDCHEAPRCGDAHQISSLKNTQANVQQPADVEEHNPSDLREDAPDRVQKRISSRRSYAHPYTGAAQTSEVETETGEMVERSSGKAWVIDITIEDANHYITESGLVNKNCIDELTHFTEAIYRYLRSRVRMTGVTLPERHAGLFPRILCSGNPGGIGHTWVKRTFVKQGPGVQIQQPPEEGGMTREFIPSKLADNPSLNFAEYSDKLSGLGDPILVRAMLDGDWEIAAGAMFGDTWRHDLHTVQDFAIPIEWPLWRGADDGYAAEAAVLWFTEDPHDGTIYVISELYKARMLPDVFTDRTLARDRAIPRLLGDGTEQPHGLPLKGILDAAAFGDTGQQNAIPRGSVMNKMGAGWKPCEKWPGSRVAGCQHVHRMLGINPKTGKPFLRFFRTCLSSIETIPSLPRDKNNPEDVDCFAAGTLIATREGWEPIETILAGRMVWTPIGLCRVLASHRSGMAEPTTVTTQQATLVGTASHPVHAREGWTFLASLKKGVSLTPMTIIVEPCESKSATKESCSPATMEGLTTTPMALKLREGLKRYIARFGGMPMDQFQQATTSTTLTKTTTTTILGIWSALMNQAMGDTTRESALRRVATSAQGLKRGEHLTKGKLFSAKMLKKCATEHPSGHWRAIIAELLSAPAIPSSDSAKTNAVIWTGNEKPGSPVRFAERSLSQKEPDPRQEKLVVTNAAGNSAAVPVFNLTIEGAHIFFANGVVSANTDAEDHLYDALRYGLQWKKGGYKKAKVAG